MTSDELERIKKRAELVRSIVWDSKEKKLFIPARHQAQFYDISPRYTAYLTEPQILFLMFGKRDVLKLVYELTIAKELLDYIFKECTDPEIVDALEDYRLGFSSQLKPGE